jgi:hypothetical protein
MTARFVTVVVVPVMLVALLGCSAAVWQGVAEGLAAASAGY